MEFSIPTFDSILVPPSKEVILTVPEDCIFNATGVSIYPTSDMPSSGRVVLFATPINTDGSRGTKVAIAPLTIGENENITVDLSFNDIGSIAFSTKGEKVSVSVYGYKDSTEPLIIK